MQLTRKAPGSWISRRLEPRTSSTRGDLPFDESNFTSLAQPAPQEPPVLQPASYRQPATGRRTSLRRTSLGFIFGTRPVETVSSVRINFRNLKGAPLAPRHHQHHPCNRAHHPPALSPTQLHLCITPCCREFAHPCAHHADAESAIVAKQPRRNAEGCPAHPRRCWTHAVDDLLHASCG